MSRIEPTLKTVLGAVIDIIKRKKVIWRGKQNNNETLQYVIEGASVFEGNSLSTSL